MPASRFRHRQLVRPVLRAAGALALVVQGRCAGGGCLKVDPFHRRLFDVVEGTQWAGPNRLLPGPVALVLYSPVVVSATAFS